MAKPKGPPGPSDPERGVWQGRSVARRFVSPDGWTVLVGRTASDNDVLSIKLAAAPDFWFHVAGQPGSHVVVRNPDKEDRLPRDTERFAAALAAGYSSARKGGRVAVHAARGEDISKPRGVPPGQVALRRYKTLQVEPIRAGDPGGPEEATE
jgi:predicted ribosome quality control (RQC) complex YloA/Tae2 family protein